MIIGCIYQIKGATDDEFDSAVSLRRLLVYLVANADAGNAMIGRALGRLRAQLADVEGHHALIDLQKKDNAIDMARKDDAKSESDLTKLLQSDPGDAQASYWLATVLFGQREAKPMNQPPAIFEYARAGLVDGPTALPDALKKDASARATRYYKAYHGSDEGWDKVAALAKANALPPADFTIDSTADIEIARIKAQEEADKADPVAALWRTIKDELTGPEAAAASAESVKDSGYPERRRHQKVHGQAGIAEAGAQSEDVGNRI